LAARLPPTARPGKATDEASREGMVDKFSKLENMPKHEGREAWVRLQRISEGGEPVLFREKFADWPDLSRE
jgi:hypothetical protein